MIKENRLKKFKSLVNKPWKVIICILLSIFLINQIISLTTGTNFLSNGFNWLLNSLGIYTEEVPNVTIKSDGWDSGVGGAWKVEKSAKWTGLGEAEVTFDVDTIMKTEVNYKDVIFVLDVSGSMAGEKLDKVKSDASELTEYLLSNSNNRVALINFDSTSTILSGFTNDEALILEKIESLIDTGSTNYNAGLKNVDVVMEGYIKESNRSLVTLFLTDGYPNEDIPNQIATYEILKEKYPYMAINGIQYEMGTEIVQDIKDISDNQFLADIESLNNVLFEASINPELYEKLEIIDYIHDDYFYIESKNDIEVSIGNVNLSEENGLQKITWNIDNYKTGLNETMKVKLKLKEQYVGIDGFYPTNIKEKITSKLTNESEQVVNSSLTPVLKSSYNVIYDTNPPTGCNIKNTTIETHFIYENVTKKNIELTCPGYLFKGWEIVDTDLNIINDDTFIMPGHDVTIRAVWTKQLISKSMEGTIKEKATFYNLVRDEAKNGTYAAEYTGLDSDIYKHKVYYYKGAVTNNNVLFGGFCWKMVRTTDTGGVKMVYNGVPDTNGGCNNTGEATELSTASVFNLESSSLAYVGYMYNKSYPYQRKTMTSTEKMLLNSSLKTTYWYADSVDYGNLTANKYTLVDPYQVTDTTDYANLVGKYTFMSTLDNYTNSSVYYIAAVDGSTMYYISLSSGNELDYYNYSYTYGYNYTKNGDGSYTINNSTTIKRTEWYKNYSNMKEKYVCKNAVDDTCSELWYVNTATIADLVYFNIANNYVYGNSFTYNEDTKEFTLVDTKSLWNWPNFYNEYSLNNYHYTCFEVDGTCTTLKYIYYAYRSYDESNAYYINLTDGASIDDALNDMLWGEDVNTTDSTIKIAVETWFESNMLDYEQYLEDTIYCNDRSVSNIAGWDPNGGNIPYHLLFYSYLNYDLTCKNETDRFTKYEENGNGKLKYPVGLLTAGEADLIGSSLRTTGSSYLLLSPRHFSNAFAYVFGVLSSGDLYNTDTSYGCDGVRPVISLKPNTEYTGGDGSVTSPYIVNLDS